MAKVIRLLVLAALVCGLNVSLIAQDPANDTAMLEQLTPAQITKWNAASEEKKANWRKRWQTRQSSQARAPKANATRQPEAPTDIGRLRYDTGAPADLFSTNGGVSDQTVGNRFTATELTNTTLTNFTVTGVSLYARSPGTSDPFDAGVSFFNPPAGTTAATIGYRAATGVPRSAFAPIALASSVTVPRTFLAAMYQGTFAGSNEIGMVTDSRIANNGTMTSPLGFHAVQLNFNGGTTASGYAAIASHNAMLRVRGPALLPVELMTFAID